VNPIPDHWNYVIAAYALAAVFLLGYWRYLAVRSKSLGARRRKNGRTP
jgi:hypothetical protein